MKSLKSKYSFLIFFLSVFSLLTTTDSSAQMKYRVFYYAKAMPGYGNIWDGFKVTTPGQYGPVTARHQQSHGNGLNLDFTIGGTISKSKNVSKYSHLDIFAIHRQLFDTELMYRFTGGGVQARNKLMHANIVLGVCSSSNEIPNRRNEQRIIGYGPMQKFTYGFGLGLNLPWEPRSKFIVIWDANILFPRSPYDDKTGYMNYKWFSTSLGIKYYLSRIQ